jgi:hypothetical protein
MSDEESLPVAGAYTTIQPSAGPYKGGSLKEGFLCAGIWVVLATSLVAILRLWDGHVHPGRGTFSEEDWAVFIGVMVAQFLVLAVALSSVAFYRRKKNVTAFILLDWRWWLVCLIFNTLPKKQFVLSWLWVGLIYQARLSMKPKFPPSSQGRPLS